MDGISVQIEGTGKKISIPYLLYAQDYCRPFDEDERNEKIAEQTISFAKSLGLKEGDYVLCGSESTISHVIEVILKKNAEERILFEKYNQYAQI